MKLRLAEVWQPGRGIQIQDLGNRLILFRFFHAIDLNWVLDAGPWNFNGYLLLIRKLNQGENPLTVPLVSTEFWLQVHGLTHGFFSESIARIIGNFAGEFVRYEDRNVASYVKPFMRIRIRLDVTKPLKKQKKLRFPGGSFSVIYVVSLVTWIGNVKSGFVWRRTKS
ncbi:hypothetical protein LINPERHAP1_LOCUS23731 [Linum perenne]